jgi:hypothetical protein
MRPIVLVCLLFPTVSLAAETGDPGWKVHVQLQPRFIAQLSGDPDVTDADRFTGSGFRIRRALLLVEGSTGDVVDWRFRIDGAKALTFADPDGKTQLVARPVLDDAYADWHVAGDAFSLQAGQYKVPYSGQELTQDRGLAFVERSVPNEGVKYGAVDTKGGFTRSRDVGVMAHGIAGDHVLEYQAGVFSGDGVARFPRADNGFLYAGRVVLTPMGEVKLDDGDLKHVDPRVLIGVSGNLNDVPAYDEAGARDGGVDDTRFGVEARYVGNGLTVGADGYYGLLGASGTDTITRTGASLQATYAITGAHLLPGVRAAFLDPDSATDGDSIVQVDAVLNGFMPDASTPEKTDDVGVNGKWTVDYALFLGGDTGVLFHQATVGYQVYL